MNDRFFVLLLPLLLLVLSGSAEPDEDRYVVIISIDGFPAEALWDERIPLPTLRALAASGAWARALIPSTPSVTWPNHTTLVTGVHPEKHGVLMNGRFIRSGPGEPVRRESDLDREALSRYPTLYDAAYAAGCRTAEVNWPVTRRAETLHASFPDAPGAVRHTTPNLRAELIDHGILKDETGEAFGRSSYVGRDYVWTSAATHLIRTRTPNLLLFHLLSVDGMHHAYGAGSQPAFTALAHADANVGRILDALEEAGIREETSIFVVSDHGFMNVTHRIQPNVLLREAGLLEISAEGDLASANAQVVSNGGSAMVFGTDPASKERDLEHARSVLAGAEGIARVLEPGEFGAYGLPQPSESDQVGDFVLAAADGYAFGDAAAGEYLVRLDGPSGVHGYLNDVADMEALFIASGRGIRSGIELGAVDNRSVAPTAAALLGLTLETADGRVLESILE